MATPRALRLDPSDNVIIAIDDIAAGSEPAGVSARQRHGSGRVSSRNEIASHHPLVPRFAFASRLVKPG